MPLSHPELPRLVAELMVSNLVMLFTGWKNYCNSNKDSYETRIKSQGYKLFAKRGQCEMYLNMAKVSIQDKLSIDQKNAHYDRLLPSVNSLMQMNQFEEAVIQKLSSPWKTFYSRNFFLALVYYNPSKNVELSTLRENILSYIRSNFYILPNTAKDKIHVSKKTGTKGLSFYVC